MTLPPALTLYRTAGRMARPLAETLLRQRARRGKEDGARLGERLGRARAQRPAGRLIWLHGASVGEARVLLQVRAALAQRADDAHFLITTGTRTSADLIAAQPLVRTIHQFAPIDAIGPVRRFLRHWRPDLGVFAESELWPNLIVESAAAGVRLALINARMTEKSLANWARTPKSAAFLLSRFGVMYAADSSTAEGLSRLSGKPTLALGNLKLAAAAPGVDAAFLADLRRAIGARPVWLAASTHAGEEEIVLAAHAALRARDPDALVIIAPRHPDRGDAVASLAGEPPRRSRGELPRKGHAVFLLDTIGELGAAYAAAPVTLVAGSLLTTLKGHNPIEPAKAGCAVLTGPHVQSFADVFDAMIQAGGAVVTPDGPSIAATVRKMWADEEARASMTSAAERAIGDAGESLERTTSALIALLSQGETHAAA